MRLHLCHPEVDPTFDAMLIWRNPRNWEKGVNSEKPEPGRGRCAACAGAHWGLKRHFYLVWLVWLVRLASPFARWTGSSRFPRLPAAWELEANEKHSKTISHGPAKTKERATFRPAWKKRSVMEPEIKGRGRVQCL